MNGQYRSFKASQNGIYGAVVLLLFIGFCSSLRAEDDVLTLSASGSRPVADALRQLASRHGWVITYEEPPYVHPSDLRDVTTRVRRDPPEYSPPPAGASQVLVPKGGELTVTYAVSPETGVLGSPAAVIQKILDSAAVAEGASYRLLQSDETFHVIPGLARDQSGNLEAKNSVLDARIYLPSQERDGLELLEAICAAINQAEGATVDVGTVPMGLMRGVRVNSSATNQTAREALMEALNATGRKLSWELLYDPADGSYGLNIYVLQARPSAAR